MANSNNPFTGTNHFISLAKAIDMTTLYRNEKENILIPELRGQDILLRSETFDRAAFDTLLAKQGCAGLRIYYGMEDGLKVRAIIVGVNDENEDMLPADAGASLVTDDDDDDSIVETGLPCPRFCPPPSPLNP